MKIIWIEENDAPEPYDEETHGRWKRKFIYWFNDGDEIIIIGPYDIQHRLLAMLAKELIPSDIPDGAGYIDHFNEIVDWESVGFDIETPDEFKLSIIKALNLKREGTYEKQ